MTTETVKELQAGDIARPTGTQQPSQQQEAPQQNAEALGPEQTQAITQLSAMRAEASKLPDSPARDTLMKRIGALAQFAVAGGDRPSWYGEQKPDARLSDNSPHDSLAATLAAGFEPIAAADRDRLESHARIAGVPQDVVPLISDFAMAADLDAVSARSFASRVADVGWNAELTDTQRQELTQKVYAAFGSAEKAHAEASLAAAYLEHKGLAKFAAQYSGNLGYDPHTILQLAGKARMLGLAPLKGRT